MAKRPAEPPWDKTFEDLSEFGSVLWCAVVLGHSPDWLRKNRASLESKGFPRVCGTVRLTNKADVRGWITRRRLYADLDDLNQQEAARAGVRYDAL